MDCSVCGRPYSSADRFCPWCGAPAGSGAATTVEYLDTPTAQPDRPAVTHTPTFVERLLGGDWRPALRVVVPTVLAAGALAAVTTGSQLLTATPISRLTLVEPAPGSTSSYFHGIAAEVAQAFGSPLRVAAGSVEEDGRAPALGISVLALVVFALLLRRAVSGATLGERLVLALRCAASAVLAVVIVSLFGSVPGGSPLGHVTATVSPGAAALWASLGFGAVALAVALRPLELLERAVPRFRRDEWYPAWVGAVVAVATAVGLGFVAVVAAGFAQGGDRGDTARLLPRAVGHLVDLGTYGWAASLFGTLHSTDAAIVPGDISVLHRHGASAWYLAALLIPVFSVAAGALAVRRCGDTADARTLSRCCYRMALPVTVLFAVLATASTFRASIHSSAPGSGKASADSVSFGPQVLLGSVQAALIYLVLGFVAGQVVLRAAPVRRRVPTVIADTGFAAGHEQASAGPPTTAAPWTSGIEFVPEHPVAHPGHAAPPAPRRGAPRSGSRRRPGVGAVVTAVAAVVLLAAAALAVEGHGGRDAHARVVGLGLPGGPDASIGGGSTVTIDPSTGQVVGSSGSLDPGFTGAQAIDAEARQTLDDLVTAENDYDDTNGTYTTNLDDLVDYTPPQAVNVAVATADDTSFCAVVEATGSQNAYSYDSNVGSVVDGNAC